MYLMESPPRARAVINGKEVDYFSGCGFYDFQGRPEIIQAACEALNKYGISSGTSSAGYGTTPVLLDIERKAARFFQTEAALHYVTGCFGNYILLQGLTDDYEVIFIDSESHYSAQNAASLAQKPVIEFHHRSPDDLRKKIKDFLQPSQRPLIMCDGIFPISGELSPLPQYMEILNEIDGALLCVDDAYATGVIGRNGLGAHEYLGLKDARIHASGTFSKALGGHGGIITGSREYIDNIMRKSTIYKACTPTPLPSMAATAKALDILSKNPGLRERLWDNSRCAKKALREAGFNVNDSPVPVICLYNETRDRVDLQALQLELFEKDIAVTYIPEGIYTSVPKGGAIRISIFATHTREQIDRLVQQIKRTV
jgi:glycine C-acetyltransferase/8-amino-7-oxononanoate synthase